MYTPLEKYLLSAPVKALGLPALINPTEYELMERELTLGWDREQDGIGGLIFTLRINGVLIIFANEILEVIGGKHGNKQN
jgi:hypothetical protein